MRAYGYSAAHVHNNEIQLFIGLADLLCVSPGHRLLVEGMEHADPGKLGYTRIPGDIHHLVNNGRIHYIGRNTDGIRDLLCKNTSEVGGVLALFSDLKVM